MNRDTKKYAHGLSRIWVHMSFKVRYCHEIFAFPEVREECKNIILGAAQELGVDIKSIGFDNNHLHIIPDLEKYSEPELRKTFKGRSGYFLLKKFPWMKHKYFWGSGLWGSQYYCYSIGSDMHVLNVAAQHACSNFNARRMQYESNTRTLSNNIARFCSNSQLRP